MGWNHQPHTSNVWYIYLNLVDFNDKLNVGKYTIHGSYGNYSCCFDFCFDVSTNVHTQLFQHWQIARCLVFPVEGAIDNWMCRGAEAVGKWRPCESLGERSRSPGIFMYFPTQWRACFFEPRNHQNHGVGVHTIDGRNPANQLRFVVYPILVEKNPRWLVVWDVWTISSRDSLKGHEITLNSGESEDSEGFPESPGISGT